MDQIYSVVGVHDIQAFIKHVLASTKQASIQWANIIKIYKEALHGGIWSNCLQPGPWFVRTHARHWRVLYAICKTANKNQTKHVPSLMFNAKKKTQ